MMQQQIWKLVSVNGKGKFSIEKNPIVFIYILLESWASFVWLYKCKQEAMSFLKNSTA